MIYFDNSATTKVDPRVVDAMLPFLYEEYGNPSSKYYTLAIDAKRAVDSARESVAALVGCDPDEVVFTSGSTESNNMVLKGVTDYHSCSTIVTTPVEHTSVTDTVKFLRTKGIDVVYLDIDRYGKVQIDQMQQILSLLPKGRTLVSIMWGNNELGTLNPIPQLSSIVSENGLFFHTDATQVVGKVDIRLPYSTVNFMSLSAHKIHGPKGIGACIVRKDFLGIKTSITPLLHGGGQESDYRSGTLSVHNIVGFGKAAEICLNELSDTQAYLEALEQYLVTGLKQLVPSVSFNSNIMDKIPGIVNLRIPRINNELLIRKLAPYVAISTGSACSSSKPSHVLQNVGLKMDEIRSSVRISLSRFNTFTEIDEFLSILK